MPGERAWFWKTLGETGTLELSWKTEDQVSRRDLGYVNAFLSGSAKVDIHSQEQLDIDRIPSILSVISALIPS